MLSLFFQRETYEPALLEHRTRRLRAQTGNPELYQRYTNTASKHKVFARAIVRPTKMLLTSQIVLITSLHVGLVYGYTYLLFTSFGTLYETHYGFTQQQSGLTFLGFGVGCAIGLIILGTLSDRMARRCAGSGEWKPEYRLPPLLPGSLLVPIGLLWFGWSAEAHVHWIIPIIGTTWVGLGTLSIFMPVQTYLIDAFPLYAASASAASTVVRSLAGAFLPLAGPSLYSALGQGWGNTVLALVALAFTPVAWVLLKYGERIRKSGRRSFD